MTGLPPQILFATSSKVKHSSNLAVKEKRDAKKKAGLVLLHQLIQLPILVKEKCANILMILVLLLLYFLNVHNVGALCWFHL